jgi:CheY-like chemotaxis protein
MAELPRILLVEDDSRVAALIADMLEQADYAVDGPYATLADGMAALATRFPAGAVLDLSLRGSDAGLLADDLDAYGIPYVFCSGAARHAVIGTHPHTPMLTKPDGIRDIVGTLDRLMH